MDIEKISEFSNKQTVRLDNPTEVEVVRSSFDPQERLLVASLGELTLSRKISRSIAAKEDYPKYLSVSTRQLKRLSQNVARRTGHLDSLPQVSLTRSEMIQKFSEHLQEVN